MKTKFTNTAKQLKSGIAYTVFADGVELDTRTTKRNGGFKFAAVARANYAFHLQKTKDNLEYQRSEVATHEGYLSNPEKAIATSGYRGMAEWIKDGTVSKWIKTGQESIEKLSARITALEGMTQDSPEFAAWGVVEYSNTGKTTPKEWHFEYHLIELTQPAALAA